MPVISLVSSTELLEKTASNLSEIAARKGRVIAIGDAEACATLEGIAWLSVRIPAADPLIAPETTLSLKAMRDTTGTTLDRFELENRHLTARQGLKTVPCETLSLDQVWGALPTPPLPAVRRRRRRRRRSALVQACTHLPYTDTQT